MPADVLASVLERNTPAPDAEAAPEPVESIGRARARAMRTSWRVECEACGRFTDAPSSKPVRRPRCATCGPAPIKRQRRRVAPDAEVHAYI